MAASAAEGRFCTPPLFASLIAELRGSGGTFDTDCDTYMRELGKVNAKLWAERGGYAAYAEPPEAEDDDPDMPRVLPALPSSEEYTQVLQGDLALLVICLKRLAEQCKDMKDQHQAWVSFQQDVALDFILRHYPMGQVEQSPGDGDNTSVKQFITKFLLISKLLCEFHVKKAWKEGLQRHVKEKETQHAMYFGLERIMREGTTRGKAEVMIQNFCNTWGREEAALEYCQSNWFTPYWLSGWAAFGRRFCIAYQTTNMPLERMHHTLKYTIMGGVINRRPGVLLDSLFGAPGNPRLIAQSMVAFYGRRLQEARETRFRGRLREMEKRCQSTLAVLAASYQVDRSICTKSDPNLNLWRVQDGQAIYNVVPYAQTCTCSYSHNNEICSHLLLVDKIMHDERRDKTGDDDPSMDFTVSLVTVSRDREEMREMLKEEVKDAISALKVWIQYDIIYSLIPTVRAIVRSDRLCSPVHQDASLDVITIANLHQARTSLRAALRSLKAGITAVETQTALAHEPEKDGQMEGAAPKRGCRMRNSDLTQHPNAFGKRRQASAKPRAVLPKRPRRPSEAADPEEYPGDDDLEDTGPETDTQDEGGPSQARAHNV